MLALLRVFLSTSYGEKWMRSRLLSALMFIASLLAPTLTVAADATTGAAARSTPVGVGDRAPDFTLEDQNGNKRTLSAELKLRPVVLIFYRGYW